jgi:thiamine biosynthesis lipoprotein
MSQKSEVIGAKFSLILISILSLFVMSCTEKEKMYKESRVLMDTFCTITVVSASKEKAQAAIHAGFAEIKRLETLLNYFSSDSEITGINLAAGMKPVKVEDDTLEIVSKTYNISEATYGVFDATLAPVIKLWKFSKDPSRSSMPSKEEVKQALKLVGYKKMIIDRTASEVFLKDQGMEIDLGGIAKGYAADKAVDAIKAKGINAALVAIAGDIKGFGANLSGQGWKVGIQNPRPETESEKPWEDIFAVLHLKDKAISTSGDYQRFFMKDGERYHHILDPETGFSAGSGLISVTVIAPEGYLADSISTAVFVLGAEKGLALMDSMGLDGVLVDADKKVILTKNIRKDIEILNDSYQLKE